MHIIVQINSNANSFFHTVGFRHPGVRLTPNWTESEHPGVRVLPPGVRATPSGVIVNDQEKVDNH